MRTRPRFATWNSPCPEAAGLAARAVAVTGAYIAVQGLGAIDPIANWSMMRNPKAFLSPHDVRMTAATVKGRIQAMLSDAEATGDSDLLRSPRHSFIQASGQPLQPTGRRISTESQFVRLPRG